MDNLFRRLTFIVIPLWCGLLISGLAGLAKIDSAESVDLVFPSVIREGETLTMYCKFNVDKNSTIYTVKWYKGSREIFRYTPKQHPAKKPFPFKETQLVIDENQSDMNKLVLKKVPMALRGNVSCEVTWEPSFTTITKTSQLVVVSPPLYKPSLEVNVTEPSNGLTSALVGPFNVLVSRTATGETIKTVNIGDTLRAGCTSGPSTPAVNLTFFINGLPLDPKFHYGVLAQPSQIHETRNKTEIRLAGMSLKLSYSHFEKNRIRVKCQATLFNLYNDTSEEFIGELPREKVFTASGYGGFGRNGDTRSQPGKLVWSITTIGVGKLVLLLLLKPSLL